MADGETIPLAMVGTQLTMARNRIYTGALEHPCDISIGENATITLRDVTIDGYDVSLGQTGYYHAGITCQGDATIILEGDNKIVSFAAGYPGIWVKPDHKLTIKGSGSLTVEGLGSAAGIGAGYGLDGSARQNAGSIVIEGGTITAIGGDYSVGIGGAKNAYCQHIYVTANARKVVATSGSGCNNPIGAGYGSTCASLTISSYLLDKTSGSTRTLLRWTGDLSELFCDAVARHGMTLTGSLSGNYKVSIEPNATVILDNARLIGGHRNDLTWAGLTCQGNANIRIEGSNAVRGFHEDYPGIYVPKGSELKIWGSGSLRADSTRRGAGIGGGWNIPCGKVTIQSGTVNAYGGVYAAGIGGGYGSSCDAVEVTGGTVNARGGQYAPGIGSGHHGSCGDITISRGTVNATGGEKAPGIGTGYQQASCGDITITQIGGTTRVAAKIDSDAYDYIGKGYQNCICGAINIDSDLAVNVNTSTRTKTISPWDCNLSTLQNDILVKDGSTLRGTLESYGGDYPQITIADGATVTLDNVTIVGEGTYGSSFAGITCEGSATINLVGDNTVSGFNAYNPGIYVPAGSTLTIQGEGSLTASGTGEAAGIGAGYNDSCGNITIEGGTITANGGEYAAGIGSARLAKCGTITIGDGITCVTATSGTVTSGGNTYKAESIGKGYAGSCDGVTISSRLADKQDGNTLTLRPYERASTTIGESTWSYLIGFDEAELSKVTPAPSGVVEIPDTLGGYPLTTIGSRAFANAQDIALVVIPESVTTIEKSAFKNCTNLDIVILPQTIAEIGDDAFNDCSEALTFLVARGDTERVANLILASGLNEHRFFVTEEMCDVVDGTTWYYTFNSDYETVTIARYDGDGYPIRAASPEPTGDVTIPSELYRFPVTGIGAFALTWNDGITSVSIPDSVTTLGVGAFQSCENLSSVSLGANVTSIGTSAFYGCANPLTIHVPEGCESAIEALLENSGHDMAKIRVTSDWIFTETDANGWTWSYRLIEGGAEICSGEEDKPAIKAADPTGTISGNIVIPATLGGYAVKSIGAFTFYQLDSVTGIEIPDTVTNIGMYALAHCTSLETCNIPAGVTAIGEGAFMRTSLTRVKIPAGVASIGSMAFWSAANLAELSIGPGAMIGENAFVSTPLSTVYTSAGASATVTANLNASGLTSGFTVIEGGFETDSKGVTWHYRFLGNGNDGYTAELYKGNFTPAVEFAGEVTTVNVPETLGGCDVTSIGHSAFYNCDNLKGVVLPMHMALSGEPPAVSICDYAFAGCDNLEAVLMSGKVDAIGEHAFSGCTKLIGYIPEGVTSIGAFAFSDCPAITFMSMEDVAEIPLRAFGGCTGLTTLDVSKSGLTAIGEAAFDDTALDTVYVPAGETDSIKALFTTVNTGVNVNNLTFIEPVQTAELGGKTWSYRLVNGQAEICGVSPEPWESVDIPTELDGHEVVAIGDYAFFDCDNLNNVTIPDGISRIGSQAFGDCDNLSMLNSLPASVTEIGSGAFAGTILETVYVVPGTLGRVKQMLADSGLGQEYVDGMTFYIEGTVTVDGYTLAYSVAYDYGAGAYVATIREVVSAPENGGPLTIPAIVGDGDGGFQVVSIGDGAFDGAGEADLTQLTSVTIPEGVTGIGPSAFANCVSLTEITLPSTITDIGGDAFYDSAIETIHVASGDGARIQELLDDAGIDTTGIIVDDPNPDIPTPTIESDTIDGVTWYYKVIDGSAWLCRNDDYDPAVSPVPEGALVIPSSLGGYPVAGIDRQAFAGCYDITGVTIPSGVTAIGERTFYGCMAMADVTIPASVTSIDSDAFKYVSAVTFHVPAGEGERISALLTASGVDLTDANINVVEDGAASDPYAAWAAANGVGGTWNAVGADGVENVFRYIFGVTDFSTTPLIDIAFENGRVVVKTPEIVNATGFTVKVLASGSVDFTGTTSETALDTDGTTDLGETSTGATFYRLKVSRQ